MNIQIGTILFEVIECRANGEDILVIIFPIKEGNVFPHIRDATLKTADGVAIGTGIIRDYRALKSIVQDMPASGVIILEVEPEVVSQVIPSMQNPSIMEFLNRVSLQGAATSFVEISRSESDMRCEAATSFMRLCGLRIFQRR